MVWCGVVTSCRALDAALVLDNLTTHEAHSLCDRDAMPACANVARSVCLQVPYAMHTRTTTSACGCAQPQHGEGQKASHGRGRHRQRIFRATRDVRAHLTRPRSRLCIPRTSAQQRPFCQLYCQHAATALPCLPCRTPLRYSLLCRGRALLLRLVQVASRSQCPPGPPGRFACDMCVFNVLLLCWWCVASASIGSAVGC